MTGAIVPDPPAPIQRTYRVMHTQTVLGHPPGETFTATLPWEQEQRLLTNGALEIVGTLHDLNRPALNALAAEHGVEGAEDLPNKAAVIAAINEKE